MLNALAADCFPLGGEASRYLKRSFVTTNHFDIDSFLSVWCFLNRDLARQHEAGELQRGKHHRPSSGCLYGLSSVGLAQRLLPDHARLLRLMHLPVLRAMARIGDFREALLSPELVSRFGADDGITNIRWACWGRQRAGDSQIPRVPVLATRKQQVCSAAALLYVQGGFYGSQAHLLAQHSGEAAVQRPV